MKRFATGKKRFYPKNKLEIVRDISMIRLKKTQRRLGSRRLLHDKRLKYISNLNNKNSIKPSLIRGRY
jgi:hypothetical protein